MIACVSCLLNFRVFNLNSYLYYCFNNFFYTPQDRYKRVIVIIKKPLLDPFIRFA